MNQNKITYLQTFLTICLFIDVLWLLIFDVLVMWHENCYSCYLYCSHFICFKQNWHLNELWCTVSRSLFIHRLTCLSGEKLKPYEKQNKEFMWNEMLLILDFVICSSFFLNDWFCNVWHVLYIFSPLSQWIFSMTVEEPCLSNITWTKTAMLWIFNITDRETDLVWQGPDSKVVANHFVINAMFSFY